MHDLPLFLIFLRDYFKEKALTFGHRFESFKDIIVAFLIVKRGKYSSSFLNISFFFIIAAAVIGGQVIAENNPFINPLQAQGYQSGEVAYNPYQNSLGTIISQKPRDKVVDHKIASGETLNSIANKYGISIDTIKWANDLKSDTLSPGDTLKIPPVTGIVHKVASGENIYTIAKKYTVDAQAIVNFPFNDFADLETFALTPGQTLIVPGGVPESAKPALQNPVYPKIIAGAKGTSNFIWPTTGIITQYPVSYHMALDIANASAPPILAADTGTVSFAGCIDWGYGCHVIIDHGNGYQTLYGHMSRLDVQAGQNVSQGQQIGMMGSTGRSTGTHCHFEIRSGDTLLNPLDFLQQ